MKTLILPMVSDFQYDIILDALYSACPNPNPSTKHTKYELIKKLESETKPFDTNSKSIKETLITKILGAHEPDQIIIDILKLDLHMIAENELNSLDEIRLLDIAMEKQK